MMNRAIFRTSLRATSQISIRPFFRGYSTETSDPVTEETSSTFSNATGPPLLLKIREDLKTALQNKDNPRLTVIRNLIDASNARPVKTDIQLLALIKRALKDSTVASEHYKTAEREDLVEKQDLQTQVLKEYSESIETLDSESITKVLEKILNDMREKKEPIKFGYVLHKALSSPDLPNTKVTRGDVVQSLQKLLPYK
ncbi:Altered inheritance of mitochondria protein 41, mitochondrial [Erysiphe neolycopersici]|uniref:Altered inheritance of mitochondria protein 41 n=1 Tax=Erysiphe neolycopersici TaxID=212602 RepID=A0A420HRM1_9PEZI|nr:Altered inheritance of mitochondria protein 41, mitochondrial [Erysiphe neolycopersici]